MSNEYAVHLASSLVVTTHAYMIICLCKQLALQQSLPHLISRAEVIQSFHHRGNQAFIEHVHSGHLPTERLLSSQVGTSSDVALVKVLQNRQHMGDDLHTSTPKRVINHVISVDRNIYLPLGFQQTKACQRWMLILHSQNI